MDFSTILYEVENNILTITLNRPDVLNAFTHGHSSLFHSSKNWLCIFSSGNCTGSLLQLFPASGSWD